MDMSTVTLWALGPYLVIYSALGLIPINFESKIKRVLFNNRSWRLALSKFYSAAILLSVSVSLIENQPPIFWFVSQDSHQVLEAANRSSVCLNVFFILALCFCYLGKRLRHLVDRMIQCERNLKTFGYHLSNRLVFFCWAALFVGIVTVATNEFAVNLKCFHTNFSNATIPESKLGSELSNSLNIFSAITNPFAAGILPFVDLSVILFSLILSCYQCQLRREIERWSLIDLKTKERIRLTYWNVQSLIKEADDIFSPIILIGSLSCVAHLVLQLNILLGSKKDRQHVLMATTITTIFLTTRLVASSLFAEMIHKEKTNSLRSLYQQFEKALGCDDLELLITKRFVQQLTLPLGFTGCGFFTLGKRYLIAMCGTILTYEIVLIDMVENDSLESSHAGAKDSHHSYVP